MKKTTTLLYGIPLSVLLMTGSYEGFTFRSGPTQGLSDSPTSTGSCGNAGCHSGGSNSGQTINVTSDIPAAGYEDNTSYTITVSLDAANASANRMGMHASIEDGSGPVGTVQNIGGDTKVVGSYFVSHTLAGSSASGGMKDYQFTWNTGAGTPPSVTVYVAANFANGDGGTAGDFTPTQTFTLNKQGIGLEENTITSVKTFPNPATDYITVSGNLSESGVVEVSLYSINGQKVAELSKDNQPSGSFEWTFDIPSVSAGQYLLFIEGEKSSTHQKITIQ
jgi:hypothetical protein